MHRKINALSNSFQVHLLPQEFQVLLNKTWKKMTSVRKAVRYALVMMMNETVH